MRQLLQNATFITSCNSTSSLERQSKEKIIYHRVVKKNLQAFLKITPSGNQKVHKNFAEKNNTGEGENNKAHGIFKSNDHETHNNKVCNAPLRKSNKMQSEVNLDKNFTESIENKNTNNNI